jgi:hypothetical protein
VNNCPTCGAPKPNEAWHWGDSEKNLFAAAPALLAALKDLIDQLEAIGIPDWHGAEGLSLDQAKESIAKA